MPVQEVRRHRRLRHRARRERPRGDGEDDRAARADVRRHQPRGHQGARLLLHREEAEGADEDPRLPRRPARDGDRRGRGDHERAQGAGQGVRRRQARVLGRGRRRDRLPRPAGRLGPEARERHRLRQPGRDLHGPRDADGGEQGALRPRHQGAHARRRHRRRRHLPRALRPRRADEGDGEGDGGEAADPGARQSRARDPARARRRGPLRRADGDRALRLPEPGQQRPLLPVHVPRRARRRRDVDHRGDEARVHARDRRARARRAVGRRRAGLRRREADVRPRVPDPEALRSAADGDGADGGGEGGDGQRRRDAADRGLRRLPRPA